MSLLRQGAILLGILSFVLSQPVHIVSNETIVYQNNVCTIEGEEYSPCMTLKDLSGLTSCYSSIYLLENITLKDNITLHFINKSVKVMPKRLDRQIEMNCESDVTFIYDDIDVVVMKSISFCDCGKFQPLVILNSSELKSPLLEISNIRFETSHYSFVSILSNFAKVIINNSFFNGAFKEYAILFESKQIKCSISNSSFSGNRVGAIQYNITSHHSTVHISNSDFFNNTSECNESSGALSFTSTPNLDCINCNFTNNTPKGAIRVDVKNSPLLSQPTVLFSLVNSSFHSNRAAQGGAVFVNDENSETVIHIVINGSSFANNVAGKDGGALMLEGNFTVYLYESVLRDNSALDGSGGSLSIFTTEQVIVTYCYFINNCASQSGGAVDVQQRSSTFEMTNSTLVANRAAEGGAMLIYSEGAAFIYNVSFLGNSAEKQGGALLIKSQANAMVCTRAATQGKLNVTYSTFINNTAGSGGALYASEYNLSLHGSRLMENRASEKGGALSVFISDRVYIKECTFVRNVATKDGAGGSLQISHASNVIATNTNFTDNVAMRGGALSISSKESVTLQVVSSYFVGNRAQTKGAVEIDVMGNVLIIESTFRGNLAENRDVSALNVERVENMFVERSLFDRNDAAALKIEGCNASYVVNSVFTNNKQGGLSLHGKVAFIHNCSFINNTASGNNHGGGASLHCETTLVISFSRLSGNAAKSGGALKLHGAVNISVLLFANTLENNRAEIKGGAISADESFKEFFIVGSNYSNNVAQHGGALSLSDLQAHPSRSHFDFLSHLLCNMSVSGSYYRSIEYFQQNLLSASTASQFHSIINTIILSFRSMLKINKRDTSSDILDTVSGATIINCSFEGNQADVGGAIYSNFSTALLLNFVAFRNSAKSRGGGIAAFQSHIKLHGKIKFISNTARNNSEGHVSHGGAIFIQDSNETCVENYCPLFWTNKSHLNFSKNSATEGSSLYGGMLDRCSDLSGKVIGSVFNTSSATSSATRLCFCQGGEVNCELHHVNRSYFPGEDFYVQVACVDQLKKPKGCIVKSKYYNIGLKLGKGESLREIVGECHNLSFRLYTHLTIIATLQIRIKNTSCLNQKWNSLSVKINVKTCPVGFYLADDQCLCDSRLKETFADMKCYLESTFDLESSGWLSYKGKYLKFHERCPLNYCYHKRRNISVHKPDSQCAYNRGGILCGGCVANYSVVLGSWKCRDCSHLSRYNFIWLTVLLALAGVVLVVFLLLVKMTVSSGTTNGLIFYANIVSFSGLLDYRTCSVHPVLRAFMSWINLDLGIEVCYYSGMDVYQKTWLQFVFPFYMWFLVGVIIMFCHYSSRVMKLMGMRNIEVLATLFLLSYSKLLKTIVTSLTFTDIKVANSQNLSEPSTLERVWLYDGNMRFLLSVKHLGLFISALVFLFTLFLPYTTFLLFGHWLQRLPQKSCMKWIRNPTVFAVMDVYHAPYTKSHRYWTGLGLLTRCVLFTAFSTSYSLQNNLFYTILAVTSVFMIKMAFRSKIYKKKFVDILELLHLSNLLILMVTLYWRTYCSALQASVIFSLLLFMCTVLHHIHREIGKKIRISRYLKSRLTTRRTASSQASQKLVSDDYLSVSQYVELRETLID